jgi:hypothetical protein
MTLIGWLFALVGASILAANWLPLVMGGDKLSASARIPALRARPLLSSSEVAAYWQIRNALPEYVVLCNVKLSQVVQMSGLSSALKKIARRERLQFVVCSPKGRALAAVQTGATHSANAVPVSQILRAACITPLQSGASTSLTRAQLQFAVQTAERNRAANANFA